MLHTDNKELIFRATRFTIDGPGYALSNSKTVAPMKNLRLGKTKLLFSTPYPTLLSIKTSQG
tara:strand:+ start:461 stop:646 length:186 start_codon:yes stop_codon:yes gene_type:complete